MKVLVIDDDPNAQKILTAILQRASCTPILCPDVEEALRKCLEDDPPQLVICDWKNQGTDGPGFCKRLRADKRHERPYVLLLTARHSKEELAEGLDAGADDFVSKPFNLVELQARLRAAMRIARYQRDLVREITELNAVAERNKLLGEMLSQQHGAKVPKIMQSAAAAVASVKMASANQPAHEFGTYEIRYVVSSSLLELRLALESTKERLMPPNLRQEDFCAWAPIHLRSSGMWMDLLLSGSYSDAGHLLEKALGRKAGSAVEAQGFMAEIVRIISTAFMRTIRVKEPDTQQPFPPRALAVDADGPPPPMVPKTRCHDLNIEGRCFRLILCATPTPIEEIEPAELRELDILAEQLPPPSVSEVPLFKAGTIMSGRFVEKLHEQAELTRLDYKTRIIRPSPLARHLLNT